ncbi:MAG TPA: phage tail assembly protein [Xanthobacteraceae bacterium]|nr:phage tail assembly protein [Xanthobacteraceae bacterium]
MQSLETRGNGEIAEPGGDEPRVLDIELDPPIEWNNKTYETLHLEEPTAHMVERAEQELAGNMSVHALRKYQIALVSHASGQPRQVIERMRISQVREAADFLSRFIGGGQATGES